MANKYVVRCGLTGCPNPVEEKCQYCGIPLCNVHMRTLERPSNKEFYCGACFTYISLSGLSERDLDRRIIPNILLVNSKKCTGCRSCELACSFEHFREFSYELSAIRILKFEERARNYPMLCLHCEHSPCVDACPTGAILRNEETGMIILKEEECNQCQECIEACPFDAIFFNSQSQRTIKCDLCGGDPACVKVCAPEALEWTKKYKLGERKKVVLDMNPYSKRK